MTEARPSALSAAGTAEPGEEPVEPVRPEITALNRPFWEGCAAGELRLQVCDAGHVRHPISEVCPRCLSRVAIWTPMSGEGEILSWIRFQRGYHPSWAGLVPYNVVLIQLAEGPRMFGNVLPLERSDLRVGQRVRAVFDHVDSELIVPRWAVVDD